MSTNSKPSLAQASRAVSFSQKSKMCSRSSSPSYRARACSTASTPPVSSSPWRTVKKPAVSSYDSGYTPSPQHRRGTSIRCEPSEKKTKRRRRRPRPAPLSLKADTLTDESVHSSQSSLKSSSLSPLSSSPTNHNSIFSPQDIPLTENPTNFKSSFRKSQKRRSPVRQIEPPKSPGILRSTAVSPVPTPHRYSPRNNSPRNMSPSQRRNTPSPSPYRSPAPSSPLPHGSSRSHSPITQSYQPGPCSPRSPNTYSSHSPRSPSPLPLRTSRFASQPTQMTQTNLALLASRRKMSLASHKTKASKKVERRTSNWLELPVADYDKKRRICSLPEQGYNPRLSEEFYRLRSFSIKKGRLVKLGDSMASRRSRSPGSPNTATSRSVSRATSSCVSPMPGGSNTTSARVSPVQSDIEEDDQPKFRVCLMGESQVGKTSLVSQCLTSDYMNTYDASLDDEYGEKSVSVALDGQEAELTFIDHPSSEMSVENILSTYEPQACMVVYSIIDRESFVEAEEILEYLTMQTCKDRRARILVGNKVDLERSRQVSAKEGKDLASSFDCKFIETSVGLNHNVDELLVGVLKQILLRQEDETKVEHRLEIKHNRGSSCSSLLTLKLAREVLMKMCPYSNHGVLTKSCENLHVL
eukprot:TRINITY_DN38619_c0_g1_i2.p1 TRINITY_DN38619_c0_g1~~TRINITY_DN38619_c0_g1_i2.p1  ORF type:complete len:639 (+),score=153.67 TRINITY_DN38619_c0_g1_i2:48-1964(+)